MSELALFDCLHSSAPAHATSFCTMFCANTGTETLIPKIYLLFLGGPGAAITQEELSKRVGQVPLQLSTLI
jgi:hypothetical protein